MAAEYSIEANLANDELMKTEYARAAARAKKLEAICRLDRGRAARNLDARGGIASIEARLCDLDGEVRDAAELAKRRDKLIGHLQTDQEPAGTPHTGDAGMTSTPPKVEPVTPTTTQLARLRSASTVREARIVVTEAEAQQQRQQPQGQGTDVTQAERHGWLKARTAAEAERITKLLAVEPNEDAHQSRRTRLLSAKADIENAAKRTAPVETPSARSLEEAERQLESAQRAVAENEKDPVLYPSKWFRVHTGAIALSPYVLRRQQGPDGSTAEDARFELANAGDQTTAYLELDFFGREAWMSPEDRLERNPDVGLTFLGDWIVPDDYEARLRFLSRNSVGASDEQSAAGGDISIETSVGWNVIGIGLRDATECLRNPASKKLPQGTINIDFGTGFVTDRSAIDAHGYVQLGLATAWSIPLQISETQWRPATLYTFIGYGLSDFPQFDSDLVQYRNPARAEFNTLGALSARLDATVPLFGSIDLVAGVRYWNPLISERTPENWSVFVGVSVPLGKFFKAAGEASGG